MSFWMTSGPPCVREKWQWTPMPAARSVEPLLSRSPIRQFNLLHSRSCGRTLPSFATHVGHFSASNILSKLFYQNICLSLSARGALLVSIINRQLCIQTVGLIRCPNHNGQKLTTQAPDVSVRPFVYYCKCLDAPGTHRNLQSSIQPSPISCT